MAVMKFRAWHKKAKRMFVCIGFESLTDGKGICYIKPEKLKNGPPILGDNAEDYEITQSTGLKDYFGVEIYEGDLVRPYEDDETLIRRVFWVQKKALWGVSVFSPHLIYLPLVDMGNPYKVVGNVFQNPEIKYKGHENFETA